MKKQKKVVVVTGAGQGVGRGIALTFAKRGWQVVIAEADEHAGRAAAKAMGRDATFISTDVSSEASVQSLIATVRAQFGKLHALINNAGVNDFKPLEKTSLHDWNRTIAINLTGAFLMAREAAPLLRAARGAIVNISSTRALMSEPETAPYSATKGGLVALTHSLAVELGPDVRANCVSPGWINVDPGKKLRKIDHEQHPAGRVGRPVDIGSLVFYLCSEAAEFITGANVVADGGMSRKMIYAE